MGKCGIKGKIAIKFLKEDLLKLHLDHDTIQRKLKKLEESYEKQLEGKEGAEKNILIQCIRRVRYYRFNGETIRRGKEAMALSKYFIDTN